MNNMILNNPKSRFIGTLSLFVIAGIFLIKNTDIFLKREIDLCKKETALRQTCLQKILDDTLAKKGLARAFGALAAIYSSDAEFASECHGSTHKLGEAAYRIFHSGKKVELTPNASYCGFGFYHGFMEELINEGGTMEEARAFCSYAGKVLAGKSRYAEGACYHGIGHGAADGTDPRAWGNPQAIISPALLLCERVGGSDQFKDHCASGIFNSLAIMYKDPKYRLTADNTDPYRICAGQHPYYFKRPCYDQMNTLALSLTGFDLKKSLLYILKIKEPVFAESAADSLASYGASKRERGAGETEHKRVISACRVLGGNSFTACIRGFGAGLVEFGEPGREYEEALQFCQNRELNGEEKYSCLERVLFFLTFIYPKEKIEIICKKSVPSLYTGICDAALKQYNDPYKP